MRLQILSSIGAKLEQNLSEEQKINNNLKKELDVVKQNKEEIANSLKTLTEDTENKKEEFNSAIADYKNIFDCMLKCDSMETLITEKMGISLNESLSIKDAITLANNIGKGFTFARKVVEQLSDYKSAHIECLTEDEIKLINVINDYYRKVDKKYEEFVALDCLGLDVQEKVSFDRVIITIDHKEATKGTCAASWDEIRKKLAENELFIEDITKNGKSIHGANREVQGHKNESTVKQNLSR